ncbi:hypothetical protein [Levilactobacillus brevis]|uniref:hypothetical protein n=1 Tax=Levilactobacillus brevis TaxID=1580 RepID=UPI001C02658F|nr:hypothetical protein [Levilactobacillus brevis]MBT9677974.1 hypothetical protein [Levilactobacillus brevis]
MNPEYFAQELKGAVLQAKERHFYDNIRAQILAAASLGKDEVTVETQSAIPSEVLNKLEQVGISNYEKEETEYLYRITFDLAEVGE